MNFLAIKGRMTANPETHTSNNGTTYCNFTVAVNRRFQKDTTDFINCTAFGKQAEFLSKYFSRGQEILCSGELHLDKYDKDGEVKASAKLIVGNAEFCGSKKHDGEGARTETLDLSIGDFAEVATTADLPF